MIFLEIAPWNMDNRRKWNNSTISAIKRAFYAVVIGFTTSNGVHNGSFPEFC